VPTKLSIDPKRSNNNLTGVRDYLWVISFLEIIGVRHCGHVDDVILSLHKLSTYLLLLLSLYLTLYVFLWLLIIAVLCMSYRMCLLFPLLLYYANIIIRKQAFRWWRWCGGSQNYSYNRKRGKLLSPFSTLLGQRMHEEMA